MVAKRFFYVSAALLCLVLVYHLGASSAGAQGGGIEAADVMVGPYGTYYTCVISRTFHYTNAPPAAYTVSADVPGTSPVVETATDGVYLTAVLADGNIYQWDGGTAWMLRGNVLGGPTGNVRASWGAVRARYRTP